MKRRLTAAEYDHGRPKADSFCSELTLACRNSMFGKSSITIQKQTARFCPEKRFSGTDSIRLRQDDLQLTAERNGEATAP